MNTFLPYPDFNKSARCLDNKRLGKQRVECLQILKALSDPKYGWQNHPAVKMWRGFEQQLINYGCACCNVWTDKGFKDTCKDKLINLSNNFSPSRVKPPWLGNPEFHASHRSNLLRKDPIWYGKFGWSESPDLPYVCPQPTIND